MSNTTIQVIVPEDRAKVSAAAFDKQRKGWDSDEGMGIGTRGVRRPVRGTVLKNNTYASLTLVTGAGQLVKLIDAGGTDPSMTVDGKYQATDRYSNFLIQSVSETRQEKQQILETFGEPYIFFFGERPRIMDFQGILLNTFDFNWEAEWWANYERYLRGTKCVESDARVYLAFDNTIVGGYILSTASQKQAGERNYVQFQFQLFVTYYDTFSRLGNATVDPNANPNVQIDMASFDFNAGRPYTLIPPDQERYYAQKDGSLIKVDWAEMATKDIDRSLATSFEMLRRKVRQVVDITTQVIGGAVVRIPDGFSGSFTVDAAGGAVGTSGGSRVNEFGLNAVALSEGRIAIQEAGLNWAKPLTYQYTRFSDNLDEYVNEGEFSFQSQYASSQMRKGQTLVDYITAVRSEEGRISQMTKKFFQDKGIDPEPAVLSTAARLIRAANTGLRVLNLGRSLAAKKNFNAVPDFTRGDNYTELGGTVPHQSAPSGEY